jgi:AbrB family looped-hinge helix DNA binding protein
MTTYNVEDIFEDIPDDPDHVLFKIPPEISEKLGLKEGDQVDVKQEGESLIITKISK